ncbi:MAG TPA: hypothetical protein VIE45_01755, partial [Streptosporangiaceae bacterium]
MERGHQRPSVGLLDLDALCVHAHAHHASGDTEGQHRHHDGSQGVGRPQKQGQHRDRGSRGPAQPRAAKLVGQAARQRHNRDQAGRAYQQRGTEQPVGQVQARLH